MDSFVCSPVSPASCPFNFRRFGPRRHKERCESRVGLVRRTARNSTDGCGRVFCSGVGFGSAPPPSKDVKVRSTSKAKLKKLGRSVAEMLSSANVVIIGDDAEFNQNLVTVLSPLLEYAPIFTPQLLEQLTGSSVTDMMEKDGPDEVGAAEAVALESLSSHIRCCISTCGDGIGGAAREACWRHLYGAVTLWLDTREEDNASQPQHDAYALCDLHVKVKTSGEDKSDGGGMEVAKATIQEVLPALETFLKNNDGLCKKKALYVRLGCRGDWPDMKPPDWAPDVPE
ncbi:hypothetical protein BSKO_13390 [Bryopsis sp. KO-2023]|nr:hypothetical protein BSKO_13390 [Bryopsis sp. KO-2023]